LGFWSHFLTSMSESVNHLYQFGPFCLDATERLLLRDEHHVHLPPKALETLLVLVENGGHVIDKDELIRKVWPDTIVEEVNLAKNVSCLRKILGGGQSEQYIETIPKRGYRFVAGVREVWKQNPSHLMPERITGPLDSLKPDSNGFSNGGKFGNGSRDIHTFAGSTAPTVLVSSKPLKTSRPNWLIWTLSMLVLGSTVVYAAWSILHRPAVGVTANAMKIVPVTSLNGSEDQGAFSPDGNQIAFVWNGEKENNTDVYVKLIGAETPLRLTTDPASDNNPSWSPDGRYIAFLRQSPKDGGVFLVPALGGPERKLSSAFPFRPVITGNALNFAPDGKSLALPDKDSESEPFSIFTLSIDTGERSKVTSPPAGSFGDMYPAFSPDGKLLAFARFESIAATDIYLMPASGGETTRLTFDHTSIRGLSWTSDSHEIVFASRRGGSTYNLWKIAIADGRAEQLMTSERDAFSPTISRERNRLAYTQSLTDGNIWRIGLNGSRGLSELPVKLISSTQEDTSPDFSPDGKRFAFASRRSGSFEIWICNSDGSNPWSLTSSGGPLTGTPRWSPDGTQIAFDSWSEGNPEIYVVSTEGGRPRRLTSDPAEDITPSWSRDGRWVYFGSTRGGSMQIWKVPHTGGAPVQVTRHGGFEGFESLDGKFFYYAKGRAVPGIYKVPVGGGEETLVLDHHQAGLWRYWAVTNEGIYFATAETASSPVIEFLNFDTNKITQIARLSAPLFRTDPGLAISPDGQSLLLVQMDQRGSDIMLAENFYAGARSGQHR
jgi:Tol biopolymer transport system component/DNA-binding winged helix-turn-helix (wHTH) protein